MNRLCSYLLKVFSFESSEMKASYLLFNNEVERKLLGLIQGIATIIFIIITVIGIFFNRDLMQILIRVGFIVVSVIVFLIRKKWLLLYKIGIIVLGGGFIFYVMVFVGQIYHTPYDNSIFLTGNTVGMIEIIFVLSFKTLCFRSFAYVALFILKIASLYSHLSFQSVAFFQFMVCVFEVFIFCVYHDLLDRRCFGMIYNAGEKLKKFQDLLSNDLPSSVMIMSSDFSSVLYSNKFFQQKFTPDGSIENAGKIIQDLFGRLLLQFEEKDVDIMKFQQQTTLLDYLISMSTQTLEIQGEEQVKTLYATHKDEEGSELHYEVRLRRIVWECSPSYAIVMNDITDKQLVTALKIADTQKDRVIATVSHELRTPINGIVGLLEMASEIATDKTLLGYLENCKSCSKLLLYLVNAILDLSQLRNNSLKIVKEVFSLSEMLEEVKSLYIFQSHQKGIEFIIEKDPSINNKIYTDKYRLIEVLINLLGNAMKFTFTGSVKLKISKSNSVREALIFCVEDTGLGIMEKDKTKLFKMFGKIEQTNKNINTHGAGLGLTIANELVKALNMNDKDYRIMFESEYNKGSRFWFQMNVTKPIDQYSVVLNSNIEVNNISQDFESRDFLEFSEPSHSPFVKLGRLGIQDNSNYDISSPLVISKEEDELLISLKNTSIPQHYHNTKRVLLIDDNPLNLMAAGFILEKLKFSVTKAFNGQEGIKLLEESVKSNEKYSLVITDIQMPVMDGLQMSKKIKEKIQNKELYSVPIVALTAKKLDKKEHEEYKEHGITCSLEKPLVRSEIEKIISDLLPEI